MKTKLLATCLATVIASGASLVVAAPNASAATNWNCVSYVYKVGSRGGCVQTIQKMYNYNVRFSASGYMTGPTITEDGAFGPATAAAVKRLQSYHGLTADGVVGNNTWRQLCRPLSAMGYVSGGINYVEVPASAYSMPLAYQAGCAKFYSPTTVYKVVR